MNANTTEKLVFKINDIELNDAIAYISPCVSLQQHHGSTSPANQGRSVREFEDEMVALRKENFNLKLRLHFIEESIHGYNQNSAQDDQELIMKQLIDSKVAMEMLRKEIQEKQDLLKEAALAMIQMETVQKETETKYQYKLDELTHKTYYLETEHEEEKCSHGEHLSNTRRWFDISESLDAAQRICDLENIVKQSENKVNDCIFKVRQYSDILAKRDETIKEYEEKVKELVFQNNELLETLELKEKEHSNAERIIKSLRQSNADLQHEIQNIQKAIKFDQEKSFLEIPRMKVCLRELWDQQRDLENMQSTIAVKTENTAHLLERIQRYERELMRVNLQTDLHKSDNRFFREIIDVFQRNKKNGQTIQNKLYQHFDAKYNEDEKLIDGNIHLDTTNYAHCTRCNFRGECKIKKKLSRKVGGSTELEFKNHKINVGIQTVDELGRCEIGNQNFSICYAVDGVRSSSSKMTKSWSSLETKFSSASVFDYPKDGVTGASDYSLDHSVNPSLLSSKYSDYK